MAILNLQTAPPVGLTAVTSSTMSTQSTLPSIIYILTNDTYATVTATGYLTGTKQEGFTYSNNQMALIYTSDEGPVWLKVAITYSGASILNTVVSLVQISSPGDVTLPTIASNIIVSTDTVGTLANTTGTAINRGSIQAGLSGDAGTLISYPGTAANGSLILAAANAGGAFNTTISNGTMGQSTVMTIPDAGAATAKFILSTGAGQTIGAGLTITSPALVTPTLGVASATSINFGQDTLNYYDEGTFSPTVSAATAGDLSVTYTNQTGIYTRIGRMVSVQIRVAFTPTYTTASGSMKFSTLPFTVGTGNYSGSIYSISSGFTWGAGFTDLSCVADDGTAFVVINKSGTALNTAAMAITSVASGAAVSIIMNLVYFV